MLEHVEQRLSWSRYSSSNAACAPAELLSMLQGSHCCMLDSGAAVSAPRAAASRAPALLLSVLQEAAAPSAPLEQLYLRPESPCSTCSSRGSALCALGSSCSIYLLLWSSCTCSLDLLCCMCSQQSCHMCTFSIMLQWSCCVLRVEQKAGAALCSSGLWGSALCVPRKQLLHSLLCSGPSLLCSAEMLFTTSNKADLFTYILL